MKTNKFLKLLIIVFVIVILSLLAYIVKDKLSINDQSISTQNSKTPTNEKKDIVLTNCESWNKYLRRK